MFNFGREVCNYLPIAEGREWLVTNGIGGYAMGTIAGTLTRRYHGLLIAALAPPLKRTLLLTKLDETAIVDGDIYPLSTNRWASGVVEPTGFHFLERFHLEGTTPVWTYACADILLEKRIWMQQGANTTYIHYNVSRGTTPLVLTLKAIINYRGHHHVTRADGWQMQVTPVDYGLQITAFEDATPFYLLSDQAEALPQHQWYHNFKLDLEAERALDSAEDHLHAGTFRIVLQPDQPLTLIATTEPQPNLDGVTAYAEHRAYERQLITRIEKVNPKLTSNAGTLPDWVQHLALAADQFIVCRPLPDNNPGRTIMAGYPWFSDWGRDTLIALPGLTLVTGRPNIARTLLKTFAQYADKGMLPKRFPGTGQPPEYSSVDTALWYFIALHAYYTTTKDHNLLRELFPVLQEIITWHQRGTRYTIQIDSHDGLLYGGEAGCQLTWMDAKVGDGAVTPRIGKPVEINALWLNATRIMADIAAILDQPTATSYLVQAQKTQEGFARFWNAEAGCCYDVVDGPNGHETAIRPNQLLAVSLPYSPLERWQQQAVVDTCTHHLLTPHGLRTLSPNDSAYSGRYEGNQNQRDTAYHQGTAWAWLLGPFVSAHLKVYQNQRLARSYLQPLVQHLLNNGVGNISEIFDGDSPFLARGCPAQARSVAEILRLWQDINKT